jgi:TolB-like protein
MKHLLRKMEFLPFLIIVLAGCGSSPKAEVPGVQGISVDTAIQQAARNIENNIEAGQKIVVLNFSSSSEDFSEYVLGELSTELVNGRKLQVVDRKNLEAIRAEMDFQMSGEVSDESAQAIGRKLGAEYIISGSLTNTGGIYRFRINTINVESAGIAASSATDIANDGKVQALLASGGDGTETRTRTAQTGGSLVPTAIPVPEAPVAQPTAPPAPTYKIGDIGPAGGIVFYDKGKVTSGWRYLEASPASTEFTATWDPPGRRLRYTKDDDEALGTGMENTKTIVAYFLENGGGFGSAAWDCDDLEINGFDDWFLPSLAELNYMYGNLHRRGLGDFGGNWYWSSTSYYYNPNNIGSYAVNFQDGTQKEGSNSFKDNKYRVRACRQF